MELSSLLEGLFGDDDGTTLRECRQCGKSLSEDATDCPACGSSEISEIRV